MPLRAGREKCRLVPFLNAAARMKGHCMQIRMNLRYRLYDRYVRHLWIEKGSLDLLNLADEASFFL